MFLGFKDKLKATAFEKYLKSDSGSAFAKNDFGNYKKLLIIFYNRFHQS